MVLAWPGAKTRLIKKILPMIPKKPVCSPFFGGGSVELELAKTRSVSGYDIMPSLVNFWQQMLATPGIVAKMAKSYYPMDKKRFIALKTRYRERYDVKQAAQFYILNQTSMNAMMSNYGWDHLTEVRFENLAKFSRPNLTVGFLPFRQSIPLHPNAFLYCDPPYCGKLLDRRVYRDPLWKEKPKFDHTLLAELLTSRDSWILHYDDCEKVRKLYDGYKIMRYSWRYGMGDRKMASEELIILSDDVICPPQQTHIFDHTEDKP